MRRALIGLSLLMMMPAPSARAWPPPGSPAEVRLGEARALRDAGQWDPAVDAYEEVLRLASEDPDVFIEVAEVLSWLKDFDLALEYLKAALEHRPGDLDVLRRVARLRAWKGDWDGAAELYETLRARQPNDDELEARSAELAYWRGDHGRARERIASVLARSPEHTEARALQAQLDGLRLNQIRLWGGYSRPVAQPEWWKYGLLYRRELSGRLAAWIKGETEERFDLEAHKLGAGVELKLPWSLTGYGGYTGTDRADYVPGERIELALARPLATRLYGSVGYERLRYRRGVVDIPWAGASLQATEAFKLSGKVLLVQRLEGGTGDSYMLEAELAVIPGWTILAGAATGFDTQYLVTANRAAPRRVVTLWGGARWRWDDWELEGIYAYQFRQGVAVADQPDDFFTRQDVSLTLGYRF